MKTESFHLDWDIGFEFRLNNGSPLEPCLIFKIPVRNHTVYMQLAFFAPQYKSGYILLLDRIRFLQAWKNAQNDASYPDYHLGNEKLWRADRKFSAIESLFIRSSKIPVPVIDGLGYDQHSGLVFSDGLTRSIWLFANQAEYLPVFTRTRQQALNLQQICGRAYCGIYSCDNLFNHHLQKLERRRTQTD